MRLDLEAIVVAAGAILAVGVLCFIGWALYAFPDKREAILLRVTIGALMGCSR